MLTINGKKAHCLRHYEGRNPFKQLVQVANELLELKVQVVTRQTGFDISPEKAKNSILALGGICKSVGGTNFHTFPEKCSFSVGRRINPEEDFSAEKKAIFAIIENMKAKGIDIDVQVLQETKSASIPQDHRCNREEGP